MSILAAKSPPRMRRVSQYETLMRKFSKAHKEECRSVLVDIPKVIRKAKQFPTGSTYEGSWDVLGMSGPGIYTFPNGVIYEGDFEDGMFHGEGALLYPDGEILRGTFRQGRMVDRTLIFADGLHYTDDDWMYCRLPDRRFTMEYEDGVQPAGDSYLTAELPTREVPPGYYDTGDGFYDPQTKVVYRADDITAILRSPSVREQQWILDNCRVNVIDQVGPRPDLYEEWLEPDTDPAPPPLPASVSRATAYMFEPIESQISLPKSDEDSQVSLSDYAKWLRRHKLSARSSVSTRTSYSTRTRGSINPTNEII